MPLFYRHQPSKFHYVITIVVIFTISFALFVAILMLKIDTDIQLHIDLLGRYLKKGIIPVPPLYFLSLHTLSGFSLNAQNLLFASVIILSVSVSFKFICTNTLINSIASPPADLLVVVRKFKIHYYVLIRSLLFAHPISLLWMDHMYLGRIPSTIWHNSNNHILNTFCASSLLPFLPIFSLRKEKGNNYNLITCYY